MIYRNWTYELNFNNAVKTFMFRKLIDYRTIKLFTTILFHQILLLTVKNI